MKTCHATLTIATETTTTEKVLTFTELGWGYELSDAINEILNAPGCLSVTVNRPSCFKPGSRYIYTHYPRR